MMGNIRFRRRNRWEAMDLGVRMIMVRPFFYFTLQFCTLLPLFIVISLICWNYPLLAITILWWLKPMTESGVVLALSRQVFEQDLSFSGSLKVSWRSMWRYRIVGDLLLRRFSLRRAVILPVTVLEKVKGHEHAMRRREIGYKTAAQSGWLTFFGIHFEIILLYGLLMLLGWLFLSNNNNHFVSDTDDLVEYYKELANYLFMHQNHWSLHLENLLYLLVLSFWEPFFIAANFSLYLQTRSENEAWDIRLSFRQLAKRLGEISAVFFIITIFSGSLNNPVYAETPPDRKQVEAIRQETIGGKPFVHLDTKKVPQFNNKNQNKESPKSNHDFDAKTVSTLIRTLFWIIGVFLLLGVAYWAWKYLYPQIANRTQVGKRYVAPERIFGLDIRQESLPENPAAAALTLFDSNPRQALSLLYRAMLVHLIHQQKLPLKDSMTEKEILAMVNAKRPAAVLPTENITNAWIQTAYAHLLPNRDTMNDLCEQYQNLIKQGSLNKGVVNA